MVSIIFHIQRTTCDLLIRLFRLATEDELGLVSESKSCRTGAGVNPMKLLRFTTNYSKPRADAAIIVD